MKFDWWKIWMLLKVVSANIQYSWIMQWTFHSFSVHAVAWKIIHIDFEVALHTVLEFSSVTIYYCSHHLGQAWWKKIQNVGLGVHYKGSQNVGQNKVGQWLRLCFGLHFLDATNIIVLNYFQLPITTSTNWMLMFQLFSITFKYLKLLCMKIARHLFMRKWYAKMCANDRKKNAEKVCQFEQMQNTG